MPTHRCLDVAGSYQGVVDWAAVERELAVRYPGDDMPAGIAKLTEGISYTDPRGPANIAGLKALGKIAVGYHALRSSDVTMQVDSFLKASAGCDGLMVDWETFGSDGTPDRPGPAILDAFCRGLRARDSRPILIYTARWYTNQVGPPTEYCQAFPLQLGNPNPNLLPPGWLGWTGWQYGYEANMPGVTSANVDANILSDEWLALFDAPTTGDTVIHLATVAGTGAVFLADVDPNGFCKHLEWIDNEAAYNRWAATAVPRITFTLGQVKDMSVDRVPFGDHAHAWLTSEFRSVYGGAGPMGPAGPTGPQGAPGPQGPAGQFAAGNYTITRV